MCGTSIGRSRSITSITRQICRKTKDQNIYEMKREATDEFKNAKNEGRKLSELFPEVFRNATRWND